MKKRTLYTLLMIACIVGFWIFDNFYTPDTYSAPEGLAPKMEIPDYFMPGSTTGSVVVHNYYSLSYDEPYEQAEWVAYMLRKSDLTHDDRKRPYFIEDPKVGTKSADWRNYRNSGYDRGHLCPAGDRRFSEQAYNETFYTSNISPQRNDFNAGIWNRLEMRVRTWAKRYGTLFVATGGVLENGLEEIGEEGVDVPNRFYKIVARGNGKNIKVIGFLLPNKESDRPLENFVVPVDRIEALTGIDFFEKLPDGLENGIESKVQISSWDF